MKISSILKKILVLFLVGTSYASCSNSDSELKEPTNEPEANQPKIIPTNLEVTVSITNSNTANPNGDGSGKIQCIATATNAASYGFKFGITEEIKNTSGIIDYVFTTSGLNNYNIVVFAYSSTGNVISKFITAAVYVTIPEPQLIWSDEFDVDGNINNNNWTAEINPPGGVSWANGEKQHYTDRLDNVFVSNGTLKIVAKKETYTHNNSTKEYTSARLITKDKIEFTYGRLDVRAKLPEGDGTWPAIWMLGANIDAVGWPACGEIDIMEHWGYESGAVHSATHTTSCSGVSGCPTVRVGTTNLSTYATDFHIYSVVWNQNELKFYIDDVFKYRYAPSSKTTANYPFTADQFIILNVAMGGSWFSIDPNFTEATMEVDYVRLYQ